MSRKFTIKVEADAEDVIDETLADCEQAVTKVLEQWGYTVLEITAERE